MIMILQLCPNVCLIPTFFSRTSLRYSEGLCFLAAKIGGWNLTPALCDWKVESRCVPERMSIWFWESKLNLNDCLKIGNPKCWLIVTSQYLCHYFPINGWSIHDFQTRRPSPGGLSDGIPVCVWYLCTQPIQKRHEETWRNTMSTHIYNHVHTIIYIYTVYIYTHIIDIDRSIDREDTPIQYYMYTPVNMNPHRPHQRLDDHSNPGTFDLSVPRFICCVRRGSHVAPFTTWRLVKNAAFVADLDPTPSLRGTAHTKWYPADLLRGHSTRSFDLFVNRQSTAWIGQCVNFQPKMLIPMTDPWCCYIW